MERLSHDLNLALEESNCGKDNRRRLGLRRRTRSAGNLPAAVSVTLVQDDSSSSPPQALITQPTDSDEPHSDHTPSLKSRHYCAVGNFESDSFNENFSPTRAITRRKRKFKKMPVDCMDGACSPPLEVISVTTEISLIPTPSTSTQPYPLPPNFAAHKNNFIKDRSIVCGKRKWSHRGEGSEMRERSFSGGCTSKLSFLSKNYDFIKKNADRKRKESVLQPSKIVLKSQEAAGVGALPGRASFTFVHRSGVGALGALGPAQRPRPRPAPPPPSGVMECGDDSSSISSSDVESIVTNESDREGDDELTDWPGIEELKVFNKTLSFRASKPSGGAMPPPKRLKKEKLLVKGGWASCKNRFKKKCIKLDSGNESETLMSDSATVVEAEVTPPAGLRPPNNFSTFSDIKLAGGKGENANETFYQSFRAFEEKVAGQEPIIINKARSNSSLQKTSSGEAAEEGGAAREIRAGCRRVRGARPALLIQSAVAEQLSRFLQDARRAELRLPPPASALEEHSLRDLAALYSLELRLDGALTVLHKTSKTTQAVPVEQSYGALSSDHKRRCYGEGEYEFEDECQDEDGDELPLAVQDELSHSLVTRSLLDPGDID